MIAALKHLSGSLALAGLLLAPVRAIAAQSADSTNHTTSDRYWRNFAAGFATSILAHEAGHVGMSYALAARPYFGFEGGKPTVYSGIDANIDPHRQFLFASAGLNAQASLIYAGVATIQTFRITRNHW